MIYIPSVTSKAGTTVTMADWCAVDVTIISCDLGELLVKPGMDVLNALDTLKSYWDWPGELVLNLMSLTSDKAGHSSIRSDYDGRTLRFEDNEILMLLEYLNPDYVVLPSYLVSLAHQTCPNLLLKLLERRTDAYETDKPAQDALAGWIYMSDDSDFLITDTTHARSFVVMQDGCSCPACDAGLTRAYLHHLNAHTPLLCHRWLVMHNQWMAQTHQFMSQK
jgi:queuine tRNA-ribosyltransferase